jgi:peptidyl-prolyl cis-trans isomerase D
MFEFVRKHTKIMQFVLFLLILPSFVLFGLDSYTRNRDRATTVAMVDGREVTQGEWDAYHQREATRIRETQKQIDPKLLDSPQAKYASLERLVRDRVFDAAATDLKFNVSDGRLVRELMSGEQMSAFKNADGSVDMERYKKALAAQGLKPENFEANIRREMSLRQVISGISASSFTPAALVNTNVGAFYERREVQLQRFVGAELSAKITLTDAEVEAYHKANPQRFQLPEQAEVEYVVLDLDAVKRKITIKPEELEAFFKANAERMGTQEERRASHILVEGGKDKVAARAKAQELLAKAKANPAGFAALAKANSDDAGSKENGGDLDFFRRGAMVPPFEKAVFSMKKGEISDVVESQFGFHVIMLTDVKEARVRSFEESKGDMEAELRKQRAQAEFAQSAEPFANSVFESADSFKTTAERFGLQVRTEANVSRQAAQGRSGPFANQRFLDALFSNESITKKNNIAAVEVGSNQMASGRLVKYSPARLQPFAEVKDRARTLATMERSVAMAKAEGEKVLAQVKAGAAGADAGLGAAIAISRDTGGADRQPAKLVEAVMRVDSSKLPQVVGVELPGYGYVLAKVTKLMPQLERDAQRVDADKRQVQEYLADAESFAYYNLLKQRFNVQFKVTKPTAEATAGGTL